MDKSSKSIDEVRKKEYEKNPYANLRDTSDRMKTGDMAQLSTIGCLPTLLFLVLLIVWLFSGGK